MSERLCTYIRPWEEPIQSYMLKVIGTYISPCEEKIHHVKRDLHLHLIMWEHIPKSHHNGSTLISDHVGTHPSITSEWPSAPDWVFLVTDQVSPFSQRMEFSTYIWSCGNTSLNHIRMALISRFSIPDNWTGASIQRIEFNTYIWSCGNTSLNHIRMALISRLSIPGN